MKNGRLGKTGDERTNGRRDNEEVRDTNTERKQTKGLFPWRRLASAPTVLFCLHAMMMSIVIHQTLYQGNYANGALDKRI